ncbi:GxxExxY protein [Salinisphaera sp. RV14]|uniref:GxxExxY protein n=1 Tax=unclassified Salinisphaera TaxID=2649847 RepID=UPI003F835414
MKSEGQDEQTYPILGAAFEVHRYLRNGFLESVYHDALAIELTERGVPYVREPLLDVQYKGRPLQSQFRADFICFESVILELKALSRLTPQHEAQVINYLKTTGIERGLLLNFGTPELQHRRLIRSHRPG